MTFKAFKLHGTDNIPEHLLSEIWALVKKMLEAVAPHLEESPSPQITLAALNFMHAAYLHRIVEKDIESQSQAAHLEAKAFYLNVMRWAKDKT